MYENVMPVMITEKWNAIGPLVEDEKNVLDATKMTLMPKRRVATCYNTLGKNNVVDETCVGAQAREGVSGPLVEEATTGDLPPMLPSREKNVSGLVTRNKTIGPLVEDALLNDVCATMLPDCSKETV